MRTTTPDSPDLAKPGGPAGRRIVGALSWIPMSAALLATVAACGGGSTSAASSAATTASASSSESASASASSASSASSAQSSTASASTSAASGSQATPAIVAAANAFLATLTSAEKSSVLFESGNATQKQKWSNLPQGLYQRAGLMVGNLTDAKVTAFLAVMKATLSTEGYNRVLAEWTADDQLAGGGNLSYGKKYYWMAIIGEPSATASWQWQFGGHHVTVNATIHGNDLSLTPSFIGAQPEKYTSGGTTLRALGDIDDEAVALVQSLDSAQKTKAVLGTTSIDLVLGPGQDCKTIQSEGLPGSAMTATQKAALLKLIDHYGGLANTEDATSRQAQLSSDLATTYFAWYGPTTTGAAAYFRVTGPHVVIEYSPQSMGGDATNHIHGIYRDPTNDYGGTVC